MFSAMVAFVLSRGDGVCWAALSGFGSQPTVVGTARAALLLS